MKTSKKAKILTTIALCSLIFPVGKIFADKLDDAFVGGTKVEYVKYELGLFLHVRTLKFAWASTRKEENGKETYQGRHYLRCYVSGLFGDKSFDTGRVYKNVGFYLKSPKVDVTNCPVGGFKACYGN